MHSPTFFQPSIVLLSIVAGYFLGQSSIVDTQAVAGSQIVTGTLRIYSNDSYPVTYRRNRRLILLKHIIPVSNHRLLLAR